LRPDRIVSVHLPPIDAEQLVADRRRFHRYPELGYQEHRTADFIAERLEMAGYTVTTGLGQTGVAGVRSAGSRGPAVLIRADMDALPVHEATRHDFQSVRPGVMHACGHDGHMAVALAVAGRLAATDLQGTVMLAFQPAEEGGAGARAMIEDGVLDLHPVDAAVGIHLWSGLPTGTIAVTPGSVFASVDNFTITVMGRGGHAAAPHETVDPVVVAAHLVTALQTLVARRRNPAEPAVLSVTSIHSGTTHNVIPETAVLEGTVRTFGGSFCEHLPKVMQSVVEGTAQSFGAQAELRYEHVYPATVNDPGISRLMADVAATIVGAEHVRSDYRTMAGEDMAFFLKRIPGCHAFVGCGNASKQTNHPHHSPHFDLDEDALPLAVELLSQTAVRLLESR
jgi:amidohydrolase